MRFVAPLAILAFLLFAHVAWALDPTPLKPFAIEKRIPWTTSHVVGSPDPPLPYRTRKAFPKLKLFQTIFVRPETGTNNLLVVQHFGHWTGPGKISRFKNDPEVDSAEVLLDMDRLIYGFCLHPKFEQNGYIYVVNNGPVKAENKQNRISRFTIDRKPPHKIDPASETILLEWDSNGHNGGDLGFGPDGYLYIPTGDGTSDSDTNNSGQDLADLCAVMLRIDVDHPDPGKHYSVPKDNPFISYPGARPEIWAFGFRNPWRMHYDHKSDQLWVGQNGQDLWEQVLLVKKGDNYGWSVTEGGHPFQPERKTGPAPIVKPAVDHPHSEFRSLTGGVVYRGKKLPELEGTFIYGDFSTGRIWGVRHDGKRVTFNRELVDTPFQVVGFAVDQNEELLIVDQGTGFHYLEPAPKNAPQPKFPTRLSETGLFTSVKGHQVDPSLIPYSVNSPLWSDGAYKERFIAIPGDDQIEMKPSRGWQFEDGAVLVKTFALDLHAGNPKSRKRIETRLMTRQQGEWIGYSYLWNDSQDDATLVSSAGLDREFTIRDKAAPGGVRKQTWHFPSRAECMVCHSRAANYVLGLTTVQMNKVHDYGRVQDNQLRTLEHLGLFKVPVVEHDSTTQSRLAALEKPLKLPMNTLLGPIRETELGEPVISLLEELGRANMPFAYREARRQYNLVRRDWLTRLKAKPQYTTILSKFPSEYERLVDPYDKHADLNLRARSYLHANCSVCHVPAGGGNGFVTLEYNTPRDKAFLFDAKPQHHTFGLTDAKIIASGAPERSTLLHRVTTRGQGQMPPLATSLVDPQATEMLRAWIKTLKEEPAPPSAE